MRIDEKAAKASAAANEEDAHANVPTLSAKHVAWWSRTFGAKYRAAAATVASAVSIDAAETERLYEAIRDNRRDAVDVLVQRHPHALFAKGDGKRTALYVASFFGRHELVKLFVDRGADRNLRCEGFRPVDVAGFGRDHAIDRMKVQFLLGEEARPRVVICTDDPASIHTSQALLVAPRSRIRLQIHFSEPVEDFISDDIVLTSPLCRIRSFAMLRSDFYVVDVDVEPSGRISSETGSDSGGGGIFVEVPAGVARRARAAGTSEQLNARSNRFAIVPAAEPPATAARSECA